MMTRLCVAVVSLLLICSSSARAVDSELSRKTLKGLTTLDVVIEELTPEAERDGVTKSQLQTDVELRLREAGLRVVSDGAASLYVNVSPLRLAGLSL
jgi:hypothetical protein